MIEVRNITDFNDYLEFLLIQKESDDLEFKSAAGGFPGSFWDTYSAFANTDGGTIVLGVQEKRGRFFLDNLTEEQIEKYRKDFWNNVNNPSTISLNLMQKEDVVIGNYKGFAFMLFFVPRAPRELRPVYRTNEPFKGTYNLHKSEIANILKLMTQKGLLVSEGYGRGMRYILPQKGPDFLNMATLELNVATSEGTNEATSEANVATSIKKRMSPEELQSLIMTICNEWISLEDLSVKIERNSTYLRNHVIPLMLASRKLQMLYPGTPNHPNQQYKVSD